MKEKSVGIILIILAAFALTGCSTTAQQKTTTSLLVMHDTIIAAATGADALCDAGKISKQDCANITDIYRKAKATYPALVNAAVLGMEDPAKKGDYEAKRADYAALYQSLMTVGATYGIKGVK